MARVLKTGIAPPPLPAFSRTRDLMVHAFRRRPFVNVAGAQQYSYETYGAQLQALVGAGTGVRTGAPLGYGQRPMVAIPTVSISGEAYRAGQIINTPLSDPVS